MKQINIYMEDWMHKKFFRIKKKLTWLDVLSLGIKTIQTMKGGKDYDGKTNNKH